ncbi:TetR/AcrR family transcriptional regulator [Allokutzneria albata]|uniref:DNA-binding transcriptional regulator YbjK n=1 Tax=Allokutzneria albata TaxID=211114 RepID=A0A1G9YVL1_ALLAB|nr:TetR family transcriptional regulator [Allokutzneria albata]SDN12406.1 DNA-binding transcriptional regulator YbjK [Allokutzneria albata]
MVRQPNIERRTALVDAAIEVLAAEGARGLTFRAVDEAAGVPKGTASNYFASREDLFNQVGGRIHTRLGPEPAALSTNMLAPRTREAVVWLMTEMVQRIIDDRTGYLALQELRLEATRRPELRAALTATVRANLEGNIRQHTGSGLPGDVDSVVLLYFSLTALIVEQLTLPDVLDGYELEGLVRMFVERAIPAD